MKKSHYSGVCRYVVLCLMLFAFTVLWFQPARLQIESGSEGEKNYSTRSKKLEIWEENQQQLVEDELPRETDQDDDVDECEGRRMYIYDLPPEFNTQILELCDAYESWTNFCDHVKNDGFGPKTHRRSKSWYRSDAYMLELIFHARARHYDCRVVSRAEADFFFIPYYAGLDALRYLYGEEIDRSHEHGWRVVQWVKEKGGSFWKRNGGSDHFVVMGRPAWDFSRPPGRTGGWGTSILELRDMLNVTSLVLESRAFSWQEQAVPYPTAFHPAGSASLALWTTRVRRSPRPFLFAFAGGGGTGAAPNIRRNIRSECFNNSAAGSAAGLSSRCSFISCDDGHCDYNPGYLMRSLMKADFCLQPPGDTPTRRSTFDGIVAGCIPVFFEKQGAYTQYTWHLPADPEDYSVLINKDDVVFGGVKIEEILGNISRAEVARMREKVIELIPRVVYRKPEATGVGFKDAFDVAIEGVLQRIKNQRKGITTGVQSERFVLLQEHESQNTQIEDRGAKSRSKRTNS